jgi:hypothetical protein
MTENINDQISAIAVCIFFVVVSTFLFLDEPNKLRIKAISTIYSLYNLTLLIIFTSFLFLGFHLNRGLIVFLCVLNAPLAFLAILRLLIKDNDKN